MLGARYHVTAPNTKQKKKIIFDGNLNSVRISADDREGSLHVRVVNDLDCKINFHECDGGNTEQHSAAADTDLGYGWVG